MKWIIAKVSGGNEVQSTDLLKLENYILELSYIISWITWKAEPWKKQTQKKELHLAQFIRRKILMLLFS